MAANGFVELVPCYAELLRPVGDVGTQFWIDLIWIVRALAGMVFVEGMGLVAFGSVMMLRHVYFLISILWVG